MQPSAQVRRAGCLTFFSPSNTAAFPDKEQTSFLNYIYN